MENLSEAEGVNRQKTTFAHPYVISDLSPGPRSRLEIDAYTRREIIKYSKRFERSVRDAFNDIILVADKRNLSEDELNRRTARWADESILHASEFRDLLEKNKEDMSKAKSYNELLGSAMRLRNELHAITNGLPEHLTSYSNRDILRN
jgi:hypothetical protein